MSSFCTILASNGDYGGYRDYSGAPIGAYGGLLISPYFFVENFKFSAFRFSFLVYLYNFVAN